MEITKEEMDWSMKIFLAIRKAIQENPNDYDKPIEFECPFCNGRAVLVRRRKHGNYARCPKCFTMMP